MKKQYQNNLSNQFFNIVSKLVILLSFFSFSIGAHTGKILFIKGDVAVSSNKLITKAKKGAELKNNMKLITRDKSLAILKINGYGTIRIEENTEIEIENLPLEFKDSEEIEKSGSVILNIGTALFEVIKKSNIPSLKVKSNFTTMGVRGTRFLVHKDKDTNNVWTSVHSGVVQVTNKKQNEVLEARTSIVVEKNKTFTAPRKYDFISDVNWNLNAKDLKKSFKKLRKSRIKEFRSKRKVWVRNDKRLEKFNQKWKEKKTEWKKKTKGLKSQIKKKRRNKSNSQKKSVKRHNRKSRGSEGPNAQRREGPNAQRREGPNAQRMKQKHVKKKNQQRRRKQNRRRPNRPNSSGSGSNPPQPPPRPPETPPNAN